MSNAGSHLADDALHGAAPPFVDEFVAVEGQALPRREGGKFIDDRAVPVEHRAAGVEGHGAVSHAHTAPTYSPRAG